MDVHGGFAQGAVPSTQPSDALTNVADRGRKPAGTGPPAGPVAFAERLVDEAGPVGPAAPVDAAALVDGPGWLVVVAAELVDGATLPFEELAGPVASVALLAAAGDVAEPATEPELDAAPELDDVQAASAIRQALSPAVVGMTAHGTLMPGL